MAIGHSMGGILLYAMLSRCGKLIFIFLKTEAHRFRLLLISFYSISLAFEGREPCLAAVATLASSLDYTTSDSALKLLIPLVRKFYLYLPALCFSVRVGAPPSSSVVNLLDTSYTGRSCTSSERSSCSFGSSLGCSLSSFVATSIRFILA